MNNEYLDILKQSPKVVGIGVTAFSRIGPASFYPNYEIVCYKNGSDLDSLSKICNIKCVNREWVNSEQNIEGVNTASILKHNEVKKYLQSVDGLAIIVYKASKQITMLADEMGIKLLSNRFEIRDKYEDKEQFFKIGREIGLPMIPGENIEIDEFSEEKWAELKKSYGNSLVLQLIDISVGGGKGTFFVNNHDDFNKFWKFVKVERKRKKLKKVNVTKFINGPSPSISGCVTKHGILTGVLQTQIIDMPELGRFSGRSGSFQGHDWTFGNYSKSTQSQAENIAVKLGDHMHKKGYKGIFGIDFIIDKNGFLYPVECNSRHTAAFPVYSMMQSANGETPLDVFQALEFMDVDYRMDFDRVNKSWKKPKLGSHLVLTNTSDDWMEVGTDLSAGVYKVKNGRLRFVRSGVLYRDIDDVDEFVLTDGVVRKGELIKPEQRIGKLIFKRGVLESTHELSDYAKIVVDLVYKGFDFNKSET